MVLHNVPFIVSSNFRSLVYNAFKMVSRI